MSHFAVIVIGDEVEKQLAPYQENNMGDCPQEYLEFNDETEEVKKGWEENEDGIQEQYGAIEVYAKEYHGFDEHEGKFGFWRNPNAKWDWWVVGGRWTGYFKLKEGEKGAVGKPGLMTEQAKPGYADSVMKKQIDFEGMRDACGSQAGEKHDAAMAIFGDLPVQTPWVEIWKAGADSDAARNEYWSQPRCQAWQVAQKVQKDSFPFGFRDSPDNYMVTREEAVNTARSSAACPFAIVKDGKWYQRGQMGWWGISTDEKDENEWYEQFSKLIDELSEDTFLTAIDCHI